MITTKRIPFLPIIHAALKSFALLAVLTAASVAPAATQLWFGPGAGVNNWSTGNNWSNSTAGTFGSVPGSTDDVKFFDPGNVATASNINNVVDGSFAGTIASLQYGNTNGTHTTLITNGATLNLTGTGGLTVGTLADNGNAQIVNATITGRGTLNLNNTAANLLVDQGRAANGNGTQRGILDMSGLYSFTANMGAIAVGTTMFGGANNAQNATGTLKLAQTNVITSSFLGTPIATATATPTNSIQIGADNGNAGGVNYFYLGQSNMFFIDSIGVGCLKTTSTMLFNSGLNNPIAYFRGMSGATSRVRFWTIGDMSSSGSSSAAVAGTNDFTGGTVDILVDTMSLGRDRSGGNTGATATRGTLIFTAGTIDVNTIYVGNQQFTAGGNSNPMSGVVNINGPTATLKVNTALYLGRTSVASTAANGTTGILNVTNGTVLANAVLVGTNSTGSSTANTINLVNATLVVTNTLATNNTGLTTLILSNSTLGLTLTANGSLWALVQTLNTAGPTNLIQLDPTPVIFSSYPKQFPLIKYTAWIGSNIFGLGSIPGWAPGATLVSNGPNSSLDLSVQSDPRPVFTGSQPAPYSGSPGDNVTTNFAVTIAAGSVTPLYYQWYFVTNGVTNSLTDGNGPSGVSTLSGSTNANLQITNAQPGDNGNYFVVVTNLYGTNVSSPALLTISGQPVPPHVTGPAAVTATNGITTTIPDSTDGSPVPVLYWEYNGNILTNGPGPSGGSTISGVSTRTLAIANPQYPGDQGVYSLIASNSAGMATNDTTLTILVPPTITAQPASVAVTNTQSASLTVAATGVPAPNYQWYKNGNPISSVLNPTATNATFTIASTSSSDSSTHYYVQVYNSAGSTNSAQVALWVNSTMSATAPTPASGATNICYDTPLYITFNSPPALQNAGKIRIYNVTNSTTPVDTLDIGANTNLNIPYAMNVQPRNIGGSVFYSIPVIITGSTAAIYPHAGVMTSNQTYYVTIDDGVFADTNGAYFAGISATNAWQFSTKPGGPANPASLVVAADGSGDFLTVQGAVDSVPTNNTTPTLVNLRNGFYTEIVNVQSRNNLKFRGESRTGAIIGYPNNNWVNQSGAPLRAMFVLNGNDCTFENLTITNTTPAGGSQAEAIDVEGTRAIFYNMELDSYQDTFLVHSAGKLVYFQDSLIQGQTDFNWGYGTVYYTNCTINCLLSGGHVTQPRSPATTNGFGFINCLITQGYSGSSTFDLGRTISTPSSPSEVLYYNCLMADVVTGYASDAGVNMADYGCSNLTATAAKTLAFSTHSPSNDPFVIAIQSATNWLYGWQPQVSPNLISQPANQAVSHGRPANFAAGATGIPVPAYQWFKDGNLINNATNPSYPIASAQRSDAGSYYVVASNGSGSVTSSVVTLTYNNTAPVAGANFTMGALLGVPSTVQIVGGKYPPTDADSDALTLTSVAGVTNGTVSTDGTTATYTATNGTTDSFTYTVSDGFGGTASATVTVFINSNVQGYNLLSLVSLGSGTNVLTFAGIPTYNYVLDLATNLAPPINWMPQVTNPAANNGALIFTNVSSEPQTYYRTRYVP